MQFIIMIANRTEDSNGTCTRNNSIYRVRHENDKMAQCNIGHILKGKEGVI